MWLWIFSKSSSLSWRESGLGMNSITRKSALMAAKAGRSESVQPRRSSRSVLSGIILRVALIQVEKYPRLQIQRARIHQPRFSRISALDSPDAVEFLAPPFQVCFRFLHEFRGHDHDHSHTHVERLKQIVGFNLAELRQVFEDRRNRPGVQIDNRFHSTRQHAWKIPGDSAARDMSEPRNPALREDVFQSRRIADVRFEQFRANLVSNLGDIG